MADNEKIPSASPATVVEEVKDTTEKASKIVKPDMEQVVDIQGIKVKKGIVITASSSDKEYQVKPCSLKEIPVLVNHIKKIEESINKSGNPTEVLTDNDNFVLKEMGEVILLGIHKSHPGITIDDIMEEFTLGDFPAVYKIVLDLNDFLSGMRRVYQTK